MSNTDQNFNPPKIPIVTSPVTIRPTIQQPLPQRSPDSHWGLNMTLNANPKRCYE